MTGMAPILLSNSILADLYKYIFHNQTSISLKDIYI